MAKRRKSKRITRKKQSKLWLYITLGVIDTAAWIIIIASIITWLLNIINAVSFTIPSIGVYVILAIVWLAGRGIYKAAVSENSGG